LNDEEKNEQNSSESEEDAIEVDKKGPKTETLVDTTS